MHHIGLSRVMVSAVLAYLLTAGCSWAAEAFPAGTWEAGPFAVTFDGHGAFQVAMQGETVVEGTYKVVEATIEFVDQKGRYACNESGPGKYKWKRQGEALVFEKIADECSGREQAVASQPLTRKAK